MVSCWFQVPGVPEELVEGDADNTSSADRNDVRMGEFGLTEMMPEMRVFPMDDYCSNSCSSSGFE